jgi:Fur family peroxide stress response transcriptional regulator
MKQQTQELVTSLRKEGFRITPQRMAIVDYVMNTNEHPSAEHIHTVIQKQYPMVSLSTVYKTLELLRSKRLLSEIDVNGESRFDPNTGEHVNLVCLNCGMVEDSDEDELKEIQNKIAKKSKYLIIRGSLDLYGYCSRCRPKFEA